MVKVAPKMSVVSTKQVSARAGGKRVTIPYIHIIMIRAGKIVEKWVEFVSMSILRQIKSE
jgi:predicted ester cyclase